MQSIIAFVKANPGRVLGVAAAVILAVLQALVGKGVITADAAQSVQNIGALIAVVVAGFFPATASEFKS